ncbi:EAL domain, c-di-GMP-specific phosphodiesterase class I (or its enzymatically inactive variant) [Lachnospiraceae bacterium NE2001]|nr:EAL domain, c-di-GMP-specific phosphodiesterase class I (or its enzymatically inactive variant) [Lachnospiraceae bacterium NE2001]
MNQMGQNLYFDDFTPAADIVVIATCLVIIVLVAFSYVPKTKAFGIFLSIVGWLMLAAFSDVIYHDWYTHITDGNYAGVYVVRVLYHAFLFSTLLLFVVYIVTLQQLEIDKKVPIMFIALAIYLAVLITDIVSTVTGKGFKLNNDGSEISSLNVFLYGYLAFMALIIVIMVVFRKRLYKRVMNGFYGSMAISFIILFNQGRHGQSSFTTASFLFPTIAMLYLIHSSPYDIEIGAINVRALEDTVRYNYNRNVSLLYMSLFLPEYDVEGKTFTKELSDTIRRFSSEYFRGAVLFQVSNGHVILMAKKKNNPDYENRLNKILNAFDGEYEKYQLDYKIVFGESIEEISRKNEYVSFIKNIHRNMEMNTVHIVDFDDVEAFNKFEYILAELGDIYRRRDLRDSRVMAYCQPVLNIKTGKYDTAEALMRLKLSDVGLVYPDQFIRLAEENGYIHVLTEIILQKTCDEIKYLMSEGYDVNRISINVSVLEMRDESFTADISRIIKESGIPDDKIAIEITESQSENDFMVMKNMINELKDKGIKFYLDDFGTGYSNMERIMELPFDIIKFDRSLVIASDSDIRAKKMVGSLASMFSNLDYSVLYEGVENDIDEARCKSMSAAYLQGYKYSRPIPIIELKSFFSKIGD